MVSNMTSAVGTISYDQDMSMITTSCPRTWQAIATGIDTDPDTFKQLPDVPSEVRCPACGGQHAWRPSQAWLVHERQNWLAHDPLLVGAS